MNDSFFIRPFMVAMNIQCLRMPRTRNTLLLFVTLLIVGIAPGSSRFYGFYQLRRNLQIINVESPKIVVRETKVDPNLHVIPFAAEDTEDLSDKLARMTFKKIVMAMPQNPMEHLEKGKNLDFFRL